VVARLLSVISQDSRWDLRSSVLSLFSVASIEEGDHLGQR